MSRIHLAHPNWASHMPALIWALQNSAGPVLELGMGNFSTPLLHVMCVSKDRKLFSYENDGRFIDSLRKFQNPLHEIRQIDDWNDVDYSLPWGVVFVDQKPAEGRRESLKRLTHAQLVVVHDTQPEEEDYYGYKDIWPLYKYRFDFTYFQAWATILSNEVELT